MSALMSDVVADRITASRCNAACNAGGKMLKAVEIEQKYGRPQEDGSKLLALPS